MHGQFRVMGHQSLVFSHQCGQEWCLAFSHPRRVRLRCLAVHQHGHVQRIDATGFLDVHERVVAGLCAGEGEQGLGGARRARRDRRGGGAGTRLRRPPLATFEPTGTWLRATTVARPRCLSLLARGRLRRAPAPDGIHPDQDTACSSTWIAAQPRGQRAARARLTSRRRPT